MNFNHPMSMYSILIWNARGVGNRRTLTHLKDLSVRHKPQILSIIEPKVDHQRLPDIARSLGFDNFSHGGDVNSRIWVLWTSGMDISDVVWNPYQVTLSASLINSDLNICYTFVHAPCVSSDRQVLWDDLATQSRSITTPWIVAGDFNAILSWEEKKGGNRDGEDSINAFNLFLVQAGLTDIGYQGNDFTWSNNQDGAACIWERLDRVLLNSYALRNLPTVRVEHLHRVIHSDHCPILMHLKQPLPRKGFFRYQKCWEKHHTFKDFINQSWEGKMHDEPLTNFGLKIKHLRSLLKDWNWNIFGNLNVKTRQLLNQITTLENALQTGWNEETAKELKRAKIELSDVRTCHADMLRAKARMSWMREGDRNSKFFHTAIRSRSLANQVKIRLPDGDFTDDREVIGNKAVNFFSDLFSGSCPPPCYDDLSILQPVITEDNNRSLTGVPTEDEILLAINTMNKDSAPGPDGFTGHFYSACWDTIKGDLVQAIHSFFRGHRLPASWTATHIFLLPKVPNATDISQLRPISLCNFNHKIISHILMKRVAVYLPSIISEEQTGFVPGRSMHDNIALAHDLVYDLDQKVPGGNVIVKLDMAKAYDRLSWGFLIRVMRALGFSNHWCDLVFRCISNCSYSIKWEGEIFGYFRSMRGVRQGDPLSPTLFIIAMEWFSKSLNQAIDNDTIQPYKTLNRADIISHLLFADDILLFTNGDKESMSNLINLINKFCSISGEQLNPSKSQIVFSTAIDDAHRLNICMETGFANTTLPITYLGAPLYKGRTLVQYFHYLIDKVRKRICGWAKRLLSMGGRAEIVRSVLNAMSIHAMFTLPVPLTVIDKLISVMASFLWDSGSEKRHHWISWSRICTPWENGGLNIRHPRLMLHAFHSKRAWEAITGNSLWARYSRSRFRIGQSGSPLWNTISQHISEVKNLGTWRISSGHTLCGEIGRYYGVNIPSYIRHSMVRDIMDNPGSLSGLLGAIPEEERHVFQNVTFSDRPDKFICKLTKDGTFTIKAFYNRVMATRHHVRHPWGEAIWQKWIPPKVSCFLWKLFHKVVPTDDSIRRLGIHIVSKCSCCTMPKEESSNHLFFEGEKATHLWRKFGAIFDRPTPRGKESLLRFWLSGSRKNYRDCLASGMSACIIWELWKDRNNMRFNDITTQIWHKCMIWAARISPLIKAHMNSSYQSTILTTTLGIHRAGLPPRPSWLSWHPPNKDLVLDIAISDYSSETQVGGIVRNMAGRLILAAKESYDFSSPLRALALFLNLFSNHPGFESHLIEKIRSSHACFWDINREDTLQPNELYAMRRIKRLFPYSTLTRTAPHQNNTAICILHTMSNGVFEDSRHLTLHVRRTITADASLLPTSRPSWTVDSTRDDLAIRSHSYATPATNDI